MYGLPNSYGHPILFPLDLHDVMCSAVIGADKVIAAGVAVV